MQPLINYILHLADNALVLGHRNSEWCGHGPILEQDIAIANISLDLIGQARNLYQYAAARVNARPDAGGGDESKEVTEDSLAYFRDSDSFRNFLLAEQPKGDWANTILRQFFFSAYQSLLFEQLKNSSDVHIAAIAAKSLKEVTYHLRWSSEWVIRLGDGTAESHDRMQKAIVNLWPFTDEMFTQSDYETSLIKEGLIADMTGLKNEWLKKVQPVFEEAALSVPGSSSIHTGGKEGKHTAHLDELLNEMQSVARAHPTATW
jgi:ring-1,2-phenylacetyl-CoA epoxidase subunit PaaC